MQLNSTSGECTSLIIHIVAGDGLKEFGIHPNSSLLQTVDVSSSNEATDFQSNIMFAGRVVQSNTSISYRESKMRGYKNLAEIYEYKCLICNHKCMSKEQVIQHCIEHHPASSFKCEMCGSHFPTQLHLQDHVNTHIYAGELRCGFCNRMFDSLSNLKRHMRLHIEQSYCIVCKICESSFREERYLYQHIKTHEAPRFSCELCGKKYKFRQQVQLHKCCVPLIQ